MSDPGILLSSGAVYAYPLRRALRLARAAGCDGVELVVCPELLLRGPRAVGRLSAEEGIPIRAIHPPLIPLPGWGRRANPLFLLVDLALELEIPIVVIHPPRATSLNSPTIDRFRAALAEVERRLRGSNTRVTIENSGFYGPRDYQYPLSDLPTLCRFADETDTRLTLDTTHAGDSPYPLLEAYGIIGGRLAHIHFSDIRQPPHRLAHRLLDTYLKHHQLPGAGYLPLPQLLRSLTRNGYRGNITLEVSPVSLRIWSYVRALRHLAEAVRYTRRMLST